MPSNCDNCKPTEHCVLNRCVDKCYGKVCEEGLQCVNGSCVTCKSFDCPEGQWCVKDLCVDSPCTGITCDEGEACVDGVCDKMCVDAQCPEGQQCGEDWNCVEDACDGSCSPLEYCDKGVCNKSNCGNDECVSGEVCMPGKGCDTDPCSLVGCPLKTRCKLSKTGVPQCVADVEQDEDALEKDDEKGYVVATGGGGLGGCTVSSNQNRSPITMGLGLLAFAFLYLKRRKRRRPARDRFRH